MDCAALIHPVDPFDANKDAKTLRQAIINSDERAITDLLTSRSGEQRVAIAQAYKSSYKRDLIEDFHSELSGDFEDLMVNMVMPLAEYYAREMYSDGMPFRGKSGAVLDILPFSSNAELKTIKETFERLKLNHLGLPGLLYIYRHGIPNNVMTGAFSGRRNETKEVNVDAAIADAKYIHDVGMKKDKWYAEQRSFTETRAVQDLFVTRSNNQLRQIFKEYKKLYGKDIVDAFDDRDWGSFEDDILDMISAVRQSPADYFATRLHATMKGAGTNDRVLMRIIIGHSETDLDEIKSAFQKKYGFSLASMIEDDTSGEYRRALLAINGS